MIYPCLSTLATHHLSRTIGIMPGQDYLNPYPKIQPSLFNAYEEGWKVGRRTPPGEPGEHMPEEFYSDTLRYIAWREGFRDAQS